MDLSVGYVHDRAGLTSLLHLERMRSDRCGAPFTLVVFSFDSPDGASRAAEFADEVRARARATDHVGWMASSSVAVILWNTTTTGAWNFADQTIDGCNTKPNQSEVFVYPGCADTASSESNDCCDGGDPDVSEIDGAARPRRGGGVDTATLAPSKTGAATQARITRSLDLTDQLLEELTRSETLQPQDTRVSQPLESRFVLPMPAWKRSIDIAGATFGLIVLSPLFLVVATAIKLTSPGPVFFSQQRSGRGGRPFPMFKFRSMVVNAEARKQELMQLNEQDGPAFKIENDPRITRIGHIIRKSSIDELPQLWNVLRGEMSIVGPRPLPCSETDNCEGWQRRRLEATPGLTCIWQVQDRRTKIPFSEWARMDIRYMKSRTLRHDIGLVFRTVRSILGRKGS